MSLIKPLRKLIKSNNIGNVIRCSSALAAASPSQPTLTLTSKLELKSKLLVDFEVHFTGNHIKLNAFNKSAKFSHSKTLPYIWLRANCSCPRCYNQVAAECEVNMASLDPVNANRPLEVVDEGKRVKLVWRDGHKSEFELTELASLALAHVQSTAASRSRVLWNNEILKSQGGLTRLPYDGYLKDEGVLTQALAAVHKFGAVIIEGVPKNENEIEKVCSRIGPIQTSHFGPKHCLVTADLTFADRAYTQLALGAHTDTAYLKNSAGLELFHVIRKPADGGGKSLLVDGFYCANQLKKLEPNDFEFLSQTKIEMISYKEDSCHFRHFAPVIKTDSFTGELEQIRFNPYNKTSLVHLSSDEIEFYYSSMKKYVNLLEHESNEHWISLNPDEILIFDNFRLLHGRSAFRGQRTLVTAYLSRDDWLSKARLLNVF